MQHDDCSSNARSDTLDKYSRFFGKTEFSDWCNEPTLKYTDGFRDLIYQINPHYISCVYKKMFDFCSTNQLRIVDNDGVVDDERDSAITSLTNSNHEIVTPRNTASESVDRSNSCIYGQTSGLGIQNCVKNTTGTCKYLCGWFTCKRPHSATCTLYQPLTTAQDIRDAPYFRRASHNRVMSPGTFQDSLRSGHHTPVRKCRPNKSAHNLDSSLKTAQLRDTSDESGGRRSQNSAAYCPASKAPIKVGRNFKHYKRVVSYIDQYREEYTYRNLYDSMEKSDTPLPLSTHSQTSSTCPYSWCPQQSQSTEKSRSQTSSGVHSQKWPNPLKTISQNSMPKSKRVPVHYLQIPQLEGVQRKGVPWANELKQKVGFFATALTINSYNPKKPATHSQQSRCTPSPMSSVVSSGSGGSVKGGKSCSSTNQLQDRFLNKNIKSAL